MKALITITEEQLEALNKLVTTGVVSIDEWRIENCPDIRTAHEWLTDARQALVEAQEVDAATTYEDIEHQLALQLNTEARVVITPREEQ